MVKSHYYIFQTLFQNIKIRLTLTQNKTTYISFKTKTKINIFKEFLQFLFKDKNQNQFVNY